MIQLLESGSEVVPGLNIWLREHRYLPHQVVNEMISLMGNTLLHKLLADRCEACWFVIIANETTDICSKERLAITIQ